MSLHYNERSTISREEEEVFKSIYSLPLTKINESIQIDVCSPDLEDNVQEPALTLFQEQLGEKQVFQSSYLEMIKEEQTPGLELHQDIGVMPIVLQEERIEDRCYYDQQTPQQEAPFFISAVSPLVESEIDLLLNISS